MPTLNKLEYLDETKQQIKSALNTKFNSGITDDDTFRSYVTKINNIYTNWPKVTGEGTNITLSNTKKGKMEITPKGNTEQDTLPNPDYPQNVKVVTGDNTIKVTGKNLAKSYVNGESLNRYQPSLYVDADFEVGKKYAISFVDKSVGNSYYRNEYLMQNIPSYSITTTGERQTYYFECKSNDKTDSRLYVEGKGFNIFKNDTVLSTLPKFEDIQIEEVTSYDIPSTPYEPYQSQTYPLNLGSIELCKIGDYQDYIYKDNGKWYKYGAIRKYTTGVSAIILSNGVYRIKLKETSNLHDITSSINVYVPSLSKNVIIRNQSGYSAPRYNQGWGGLAIAYSAEVSSQIGEFETSEQLLNWFNNNEEVYIAINPTYDYIDITEITDTDLIEQLEGLLNTKSYDTQTNISSTYATGNSQIILSASALKKGGN